MSFASDNYSENYSFHFLASNINACIISFIIIFIMDLVNSNMKIINIFIIKVMLFRKMKFFVVSILWILMNTIWSTLDTIFILKMSIFLINILTILDTLSSINDAHIIWCYFLRKKYFTKNQWKLWCSLKKP